MKRFKNILLFATGAEQDRSTVARALDLAERNQGQLGVLGVVQELPRDLQRLAAGLDLGDLQELAGQSLRSELERFVGGCQMNGLPLKVEVACGKPFVEIIHAVQRNRHDLVMLSAEGRGGLGAALFGSTSVRLMRKCPCPVWVLKPNSQVRFARILAAVDPDPMDAVRDGVNAKVMELASSLAELEGSELHVVHAWESGGRDALWGLEGQVPESQLVEWMAETREAHRQRFDQFLGRFDLKDVRQSLHLVEGEPGMAIPQLAEEQKIDLIVMGTLARTGLEGYLIGNTAEAVLQRVACSVLTVKPDGFVSPVKSPPQPVSQLAQSQAQQ